VDKINGFNDRAIDYRFLLSTTVNYVDFANEFFDTRETRGAIPIRELPVRCGSAGVCRCFKADRNFSNSSWERIGHHNLVAHWGKLSCQQRGTSQITRVDYNNVAVKANQLAILPGNATEIAYAPDVLKLLTDTNDSAIAEVWPAYDTHGVFRVLRYYNRRHISSRE